MEVQEEIVHIIILTRVWFHKHIYYSWFEYTIDSEKNTKWCDILAQKKGMKTCFSQCAAKSKTYFKYKLKDESDWTCSSIWIWATSQLVVINQQISKCESNRCHYFLQCTGSWSRCTWNIVHVRIWLPRTRASEIEMANRYRGRENVGTHWCANYLKKRKGQNFWWKN